jgi:hypothetical protein
MGAPQADDARPDAAEQAMRIASGYAASQILFNADELGLFQLLKEGPRDLHSLAQAVGLKPGPLERLLIGCCSLGLLSRAGERFTLTDLSRTCLLKGEPGYIGGLFAFLQRGLYPLWAHLDEALREEKPQWDKVPGVGKEGPFEALYRDERVLREFQAAMYQLSYPSARAACEHFDFSRFHTVVDIGGGTGGFVIGVCQRFPKLRGVIFDLPAIENVAVETVARAGLAERIRFVSGDFFTDPLPEGDLYVLGDILHDWGTSDGTQLLKKIYAALPGRGAVFIVENLFNENKDGPYLSSIINLTMLVATYGEQRTPAEFENWLKSVGFSRFEHRFLPSPRSYFVGWKE